MIDRQWVTGFLYPASQIVSKSSHISVLFRMPRIFRRHPVDTVDLIFDFFSDELCELADIRAVEFSGMG